MNHILGDLQRLVDRLWAITVELSDDHRELAAVLASENQCRVQVYLSAEGTEGQKSHAARLQALDFTSDVFKIKGSIAALEAERTYLLTLIPILQSQSTPTPTPTSTPISDAST